MNFYRAWHNERGVALVAAIYVMLVLVILGTAILVVATNERTGVAQGRKSNQSLSVAESAAEYAVWLLRTAPTQGGKGKTGVNAPSDYPANRAISEGMYENVDVKDANGTKIGVAKVIVQRLTATSTNERRIVSSGQACLDAACTTLGPVRMIQEIVEIVSVPGSFYNYALFYNSTINNSALDLDSIWMSGGLYAGHGQNVVLKTIVANGHIYAHQSVRLASCNSGQKTTMAYGKNMYTFGVIENKTNCLYPLTAAYENYNGGVHNDTFPEVTTQVWNNRAWYRGNSDKYFPSDAATNLSADQDVAFCSDAGGNIHYDTGGLPATCTSSDPRLNDAFGDPFEFGIVFVAGKVKVHGTFKGQLTFVAAGNSEAGGGEFPNNGSDLWIGNKSGVDEGDGSDDLRALRTKEGVPEVAGKEVGGCQDGIDPDPDGTDSMGLVAATIAIDAADTPCQIRAIFWAKNDINFINQCLDCPPQLDVHATILEVGNQLTMRGEKRNLHLYYDDGLIENLPPGVQGDVSLSIVRKSYQEIYPR